MVVAIERTVLALDGADTTGTEEREADVMVQLEDFAEQ